MCGVLLLSVSASSAMAGHPHVERQIFFLRGTLTKVDVVSQAVEMDTVDPTTKQARNLLVFVDKKTKFKRGKTRMVLSDLKAGQQVRSTIELTHDEAQAERFIALEVQLP